MSQDLRKRLIRVAYENPGTVRDALMPLITAATHQPGTVWKTNTGWRAKNRAGEAKTFSGEAAQEQAKAFAKGQKTKKEKGQQEEKRQALQTKVEKKLDTLARKSGVSRQDVEKLTRMYARRPSVVPNKLVFDHLFPKEKRFGFSDLDFRSGMDPKLVPDEKKLKQYDTLVQGLYALEKLHGKLKKLKG